MRLSNLSQKLKVLDCATMGSSHSQPRAANVLTTLVAKLNEVDAKQQAKLTPPSPAPRSVELPAARSSIATAIAKHQNPIDCASARYIVHSLAHKQNGMGSSLHVMTAMLGYAMQNNRVLIVAQDLSPCKANKVPSRECDALAGPTRLWLKEEVSAASLRLSQIARRT